MSHDLVLAVHVAAGVLGVVLGPLVVWRASRGRTDRLATGYHGSVAVVCVSALGLAALDIASLWWLVPISLGTYAFLLRGVLAGRGRRPGWATSAIRGYGGAYIALWTAIVVVSAGSSVLTWLVPALVGTPVVELLAARVNRELSMINKEPG